MKIKKESNLVTSMGKEAYGLLHKEDVERVSLHEKCDCGSRIQHNDGGNYHSILRLTRDETGRYWVKYDSTCTLTRERWEELKPEDLADTIESFIENHGLPNVYLSY